MTKRHKQAAEWLIWLEDLDFSAGVVRRWKAWSKRSEKNRQAFGELEHFTRKLDDCRDELRELPLPTRRECDADTSPVPQAANRFLDHPAVEFSGGWGRLGNWPARQRRVAAMAGMAVILIGIFYAIVAFRPGLELDEPTLSYQTAVSEHREIVLPDGSEVSMGARSSLSVNFSMVKRIVVLEAGEALFSVSHEPERPFIVVAGASTITAIGTAFNVRRDGTRVIITVTEGTIEVMRTPHRSGSFGGDGQGAQEPLAITASAGMQAVVGPTGLSLVELSNPVAVTEWQIGHLQYRSEPLKYVVADVNRYSTKEIIIADSEVEAIVFTGSVFQDQTEDWLKAIEIAFPVEAVEVGEKTILIRKR